MHTQTTYHVDFIPIFPIRQSVIWIVQVYSISSSLQFSSALLRWIKPWSSTSVPRRLSTRSREPPESIWARASQSAGASEHPHKLNKAMTHFRKCLNKSKHPKWSGWPYGLFSQMFLTCLQCQSFVFVFLLAASEITCSLYYLLILNKYYNII